MVTTAPLVQRLRRGARIQACYPVKSLPPLYALDSAFQLQEYISLLIRLDPHDVERIVNLPDKSVGEDGTEVVVDEACWIYEHLRRLAQDLSHPLITVLQQECNRATCPEMKAGEWLYLCVAHGNDGAMEQCCAIDYIIHTLDSATALLNSPRVFPSRLQIPATSHRHFSNLARRLSRVFAHAYYHHRDAFEQAEAESSLYARFTALSARFALVPQDFLVIPPRGQDEVPEHAPREPPPSSMHGREPGHDFGIPAEPGLPPQQSEGGMDEFDPLQIPPTNFGGSDREASPNRRAGRTRTDTMVLSEASALAEQLASVGISLSHGDEGRETIQAEAPPEEADLSGLSAESILDDGLEGASDDPFADQDNAGHDIPDNAEEEEDIASAPEGAEVLDSASTSAVADEKESLDERDVDDDDDEGAETETENGPSAMKHEPLSEPSGEAPDTEVDEVPQDAHDTEVEKPTGVDAAVAETEQSGKE